MRNTGRRSERFSTKTGWFRRASASVSCVALAGVLTLGTSCVVLRSGPGEGASEPAPTANAPESTGEFRIYVARSGTAGGTIDLSGLPVSDDAVMLYEHQFGLYPRIWKGKVEHGGTPVGLDLVAHTRKLRQDIQKHIPDPHFDGLACLNYETRALLWKNLGEEYRALVRGRIRSVRPEIDADELERLSQEAYDTATRRYMKTTLALCRQLRPKARWGMYFFPGGTYKLEDYEWLVDSFDVLMPSMYPYKFSVRGRPQNQHQAPLDVFEDALVAKLRLSHEFSRGEKPIYLFVRTRYHPNNPLYSDQTINDDDAKAIIFRPEEEGIDGLIFWLHASDNATAQLIERNLRRLEPLMREAIRRRGARVE
ncbi:MAG: hypothetical protein Tsb0013_20740 [Phycisphaerales bacterium]